MSVINFPILYIPDPVKGRPLFDGQIFVGEPDLDPEIVGNQKQLNVIEEDGTVVPVSQPFVLSAGGVPVYNGNPVRLDVDGNYSFKILSKLGAQTYYVENVFAGQPITASDFTVAIQKYTLSQAISLETAAIGQIVQVTDRADGQFEYVLASGVTPNTYNIIQCTGVISTLALVLRQNKIATIRSLGITNGLVSVGASGVFATLNECFNFLKNINYTGEVLEVNLLTAFVMDEQLFIYGDNFGNVTITSFDAEVTIARSALTAELGSVDTARPAFGGIACTMPIIDALFTMDTSGGVLARRDGYFVENGMGIVKPGAGFKNCDEVGIYANSGSKIQAQGTDCSGCVVYGYFAFKGSSINVEFATANGCGQYGAYINRGSHVSANDATFNDNTINAIRCIRGSTVAFEDGIALRSGAAGLYVLNSKISAIRADLSDSVGEAIYSHNGSEVDFEDGVATGCGGLATLHAFRCGVINAGGSTVTGSLSATAAVLSQRASTINFQSGDCSGSTALYGIRCSEGSNVNATLANAQKGGSTDPTDCSISAGGIITFHGGTGGGVVANTLTTLGILFR